MHPEIPGANPIDIAQIETHTVIGHPTRAQVYEFEGAIRQLPSIDPVTVNHFSHGVYGREMRVPAGSVISGHIHKFENLNVLLEGEMSVLTEDGIKRVQAGFVVVSPPGTKRIAYAHTDCRWLTIHGTEDRDLDKIEQKFIAHTEQDYIAFCEQQALEGK